MVPGPEESGGEEWIALQTNFSSGFFGKPISLDKQNPNTIMEFLPSIARVKNVEAPPRLPDLRYPATGVIRKIGDLREAYEGEDVVAVSRGLSYEREDDELVQFDTVEWSQENKESELRRSDTGDEDIEGQPGASRMKNASRFLSPPATLLSDADRIIRGGRSHSSRLR